MVFLLYITFLKQHRILYESPLYISLLIGDNSRLEPTTHKLEQNCKTKSEGQNKIQKKMSAKHQQNNKPTPCWNITPSGPANSPTQNIQMIQINKTYCKSYEIQ